MTVAVANPQQTNQPQNSPGSDANAQKVVNQDFIGLTEQLSQLNKHLARKTSLKFMFVSALLQGLGYLLGATVVASILIAVMIRFLSTLNFPAMINGLLQTIQLPSPTQQIDLSKYSF